MITYPLNNIEYQAEDAELFHCTRTSGVWAKDDFPFSVTGSNNSITVGKGIAWINNDEFSGKVVAQKATTTLDLGVPDSTYPRFDVVAIQFSSNENETKLVVKKGTPASTPLIPSISRTASLYELYLCKIYRPAGAAVVTASSVTDLRLNPQYCGIMADSVTSVNTEQINNQINEFIATLRDTIDDIQSGAGVMLENYWSDNGVIPVSRGGTGKKTLQSGYFLTGNNESPVNAVSPSSALSTMGLSVPVTVNKGGTGKTSFTSGSYLIGNGSSSISTVSKSNVVNDIGAQPKFEALTTAAHGSTPLVGKYLNMQVQVANYKTSSTFLLPSRYSTSYGYGIQLLYPSNSFYLISAAVSIQMNSSSNNGIWAELDLVYVPQSGNERIIATADYSSTPDQAVREILTIPLYLDLLYPGYLYLRLEHLSSSQLSKINITNAKFTVIRL